ncbi:MAG: sensor histidine kinase [Myxococcota bacterium]|nr:sensor histidine kinase [Myxococcota bacterium]
MKFAPQSPGFRRRMTPLAILAGMLVGILLPWVNEDRLRAQRMGECASWAQQLGAQLGRHAALRPELWGYDGIALRALTEALTRPPLNASVTIDLPHRRSIFRAGPVRPNAEVSGWSPVLVEGQVVGRVEVRVDAETMQNAIYQTWLIGSTLGLILAVTLFFLPSATVRRGDAQNEALWSALLEANAMLEARVTARTLELRRLGGRLLEVQEEERKRLSRDLHDDLGQILTGLRLRLTALSTTDISPAAEQQLTSAIKAVDMGVDQVRRLAHNLRPPALDSLGLADGLRSFAMDWSALSQLDLRLELESVDLNPIWSETIFRVAQEAMTNVSRHAHATTVEIRLWQDEAWVYLRIDDNGVGLADEHAMGLGLIGIRERLGALGGGFTLHPSNLGGVCFHVKLPVHGDHAA